MGARPGTYDEPLMADSESRRRLISSTPRLTRDEITNQAFPQAFRGISETAVRGFLRRIADEYDSLRVRAEELTGCDPEK